MNVSGRQKPDTRPPRLTQHGLALPASVLNALQMRGIYCVPSISLEHQHLAGRYVLRGVESGGAVSDLGRACAFVAEDGSPLPWLQAIHSIAVNGRHAIFLAESIVRLEILRSVRTWDLAITFHTRTSPSSPSPRRIVPFSFRGIVKLPPSTWVNLRRARQASPGRAKGLTCPGRCQVKESRSANESDTRHGWQR